MKEKEESYQILVLEHHKDSHGEWYTNPFDKVFTWPTDEDEMNSRISELPSANIVIVRLTELSLKITGKK